MKAVIKVDTKFTIEVEGFNNKGNEILERIQCLIETLKANNAADMVDEIVTTRIAEALCEKFNYYDEGKGLSIDVNEYDLGAVVSFVNDKGDEQ